MQILDKFTLQDSHDDDDEDGDVGRVVSAGLSRSVGCEINGSGNVIRELYRRETIIRISSPWSSLCRAGETLGLQIVPAKFIKLKTWIKDCVYSDNSGFEGDSPVQEGL